MPVDIDKLHAFQIPSVRQTLTPEAIALYALSIGMGRDPLDSDQLRFVDPLQGPPVMPAMVLVMAHPGFWMADPASGVDPKAVLHAAQAFEILAPLPNGGEVRSESRVTDVFDKGEGKAALIVTETDLSDSSGSCFARLTRTTFIRGGGGFGGGAGPSVARPQAPHSPPDYIRDLSTGKEQALLYRMNGDLNPLHSDAQLATRLGFDAPILHGLCTMGVVTHALLGALTGYQPQHLRRVRLDFAKPLYPGETIRTEIWRDGSFRARVLERDVVVISGGQAAISETPFKAKGV